MHTRLIERIQHQAASVADPENAVRLAEWLSDVLADVAPIGNREPSRTLIRNLRQVGELRVVRDGVYQIGVGGDSGSPDDKAPRNTIADFLVAHPEFRTRKRGVPSAYAWRILSDVAKNVLQRERAGAADSRRY